MKSGNQILTELVKFTGSHYFYSYGSNIQITEGVNYLINEAKCRWLVDNIIFYQCFPKVKEETFQIYKLNCNLEDKLANIVCLDGEDNVLYEDSFSTNFPLEKVELIFDNGVIMLAWER